MKKRILIGICLVIFIIAFYAILFNIFLDHIILTIFTYVFFITLGLLVLIKLYKFYKKSSPAVKTTTKIINNIFQIALLIFLIVLIIKEFYEMPFLNLKYALITVIVLGVLSILFPYEEYQKIKGIARTNKPKTKQYHPK